MVTIDNLIMKYKVEILPQGAEDWDIICRLVAKEYACKIIDEIEWNPKTYTWAAQNSSGIESTAIAQLKNVINNQ